MNLYEIIKMRDLGYRIIEYSVGLTFAVLMLQTLMENRLKAWAVDRQYRAKK